MNFYITVLFLVIAQFTKAQNDTLTGVLFKANEKALKRHQVSLGRASPITVKTDKFGIFVFSNISLNDTLFVGNKRGKNAMAIPVNGYPFVAIQSHKGNFRSNHDAVLAEQIMRQIDLHAEVERRKNTSVLKKEEIEKSGCRDLPCLLARFSGVTVNQENRVFIGGPSSLQSSTGAIIVLDGVIGAEDISSISINDVEEIYVSRDASMYGVRGANGAVVIRTKR